MEKVFVTEDVIEDIKKSLKYLHDSCQHVCNLYTHSLIKDQKLRSNMHSNITNLLNVAYHVHDTLESSILLLPPPPPPPLPSSSSSTTTTTTTIGNGMKTWLKTLLDLITDFTNLRRTIMNDYVLRIRKRIHKAMGEQVNVSTIMTLFYEYDDVVNSTNNNGDYYYMDDFETMILKKLMKERHESMVLISDGMEKLEKVLFETYVMVQKQVILINGGGADDQKLCDESLEILVFKENEFRDSWKENFFEKLFAFIVCFILAVLISQRFGMGFSHVDIP